jgi:hypothetical protein
VGLEIAFNLMLRSRDFIDVCMMMMYILLYDVFLKHDNQFFEQDIFHESLNECHLGDIIFKCSNCGHVSVSE